MSNLAGAIVESMKQHERKPSDFYPTPPEATVAFLERYGARLRPGADVGEPACGTGEISRTLAWAGYNVTSSDLRQTGYGDGGIDFLDGSESFDRYCGISAIISNPPFALAEAFIRRATAFSPFVALLLKANYWHTGRGAKLWKDCPPTDCLPLSWRLAFLRKERGNSPLMDCSWFVWIKGDPPMPQPPLLRPRNVPEIDTPLRCRLATLYAECERMLEILHG